jgi:hypothetical protein
MREKGNVEQQSPIHYKLHYSEAALSTAEII